MFATVRMASSRLPVAALTLKQGCITDRNTPQHRSSDDPAGEEEVLGWRGYTWFAVVRLFLQRQNVLGLYRNMMRTIRQVPDEGDRKDLRYWASDEFKRNKNATNQDAI
ncbi:LYR motif-containing protein 2-like [Oncorhynchus clarkii lewisi]|uniref:LYR motif-containing protein 2-like n=1 Tax=Oncorhynchus clarkii lewisi TaxID=490388 RepID=UPI0039B8BD2C